MFHQESLKKRLLAVSLRISQHWLWMGYGWVKGEETEVIEQKMKTPKTFFLRGSKIKIQNKYSLRKRVGKGSNQNL